MTTIDFALHLPHPERHSRASGSDAGALREPELHTYTIGTVVVYVRFWAAVKSLLYG